MALGLDDGVEGQAPSIEHLQELYTVVAAVSVALAGEKFTAAAQSGKWVHQIPLILAFLVTLVPFFHGTLLHLDKTYMLGSHISVHYGRLLSDFCFLFAEACVLVLLAISVTHVFGFTSCLAVLLALDLTWARVTSRRAWNYPHDGTVDDWFHINLRAMPLVVLLAVLAMFNIAPDVLAWLVLVIAAARTVWDYARNEPFYRGG